jgi:hypothetical protein
MYLTSKELYEHKFVHGKYPNNYILPNDTIIKCKIYNYSYTIISDDYEIIVNIKNLLSDDTKLKVNSKGVFVKFSESSEWRKWFEPPKPSDKTSKTSPSRNK